jgi:dienelactone hydrolase
VGETITYASNGGSAEGYLAAPVGGAAGKPGVIVIQEWWGLVPHIENLAERFAQQGYGLALWSATLSDDIVATAGFYPPLPWERMSPQWDRYAGKAAVIHCSEGDGTGAAAGIQQAKARIEHGGGAVTLYDYPGTEHAFFNDTRPEVYAPEAAQQAWRRTLDLFGDRLS